MTRLLISLLLLQIGPAPTGVATGVVLSSNGMPAAGVRVYAIPAGDPNVAANSATVFESLAQTDASGRYRLEVPPGRYYIASGSVNSPTYYPNESTVATARVVTITAGTTVEGVNFSRYVPASTSPNGIVSLPPLPLLPPGSTGVLSGIIRYPDGTPASGVPVVAVPVSALTNSATGAAPFIPTSIATLGQPLPSRPNAGLVLPSGIFTLSQGGAAIFAVTDNSGRYRLSSVPPNAYNLLAGYADSPAFYPGTSDVAMATRISTTPATVLDTLHFTIPSVKGTSLRVRATSTTGAPAGGATLNLRRVDPAPTGVTAFLPQRSYQQEITNGDGSAEFINVIPGKYSLVARMIGTTPISNTIDIKDQPVDLGFKFSINLLRGRVLWDDGTPFSDPVLNEVAVSTVSNPNLIATSIFTLSANGSFSGAVETEEYRFFIRRLPDDYAIKSVTSGTKDLMKETLRFKGDETLDVEVRVEKSRDTTPKVRGKVQDAITGMPPAAERVQLCCIDSGPVERISTVLHSDGSFEFSGVPSGHYTAELKGRTSLGVMNPSIDVGDQGMSEVTLVSASQFVTIQTTIAGDGSVPFPGNVVVTVTMTPVSGVGSVTMIGALDGLLLANAPIGVQYNISISNLPAGLKVKSLQGIPPPANSPPGFAGLYKPITNGVISIVLTRSD